MYHYVRELRKSRFPGIRGLELALFKEQLAYLRKHYVIVSAESCVEALRDGTPLPPNAALLTFDDGFVDHYVSVFPILDESGVSACFFPPGQAIVERRILDVHKIHFILAAGTDPTALLDTIFRELDSHRKEYELPANDYYIDAFAVANRFDTKEVALIKRLLQTELPAALRGRLVDVLFERFVAEDQDVFARELYMSVDQLRHLSRRGMTIGAHGWTHRWMDSLTAEEQEREIDQSLDFLTSITGSTENWVMSYPYGGYNGATTKILSSKRCAMAFTTEVNLAELVPDKSLILPRIDTNDLPRDAEASPNGWTSRIVAPAFASALG